MQVLMKIFSKKTQNKGLVLIIKESDNTMSLQSAIDKKLHLIIYIWEEWEECGWAGGVWLWDLNGFSAFCKR